MPSYRLITVICLALAPIAALVSLAVPAPAGPGPEIFHGTLAVSLAMFVLSAGTTIVFAQGLGEFKTGLRVAYGIMVAGFLVMGLSFLQLPVFSLLNQLDSPWLTQGGVSIPFLVALVAIFWGLRGFARLLGVRTVWRSFLFVLALGVTGGVLSTLPPHVTTPLPELGFDIASAALSIVVILAFGTAILSYVLLRKAGPVYTPALTWLSIAFTANAAGGVVFLVTHFLLPSDSDIIKGGPALMPFVFGGLCLIKAADAFNVTAGKMARALPLSGTSPFDDLPYDGNHLSPVDVVMYTANLASNPAAITDIMDEVRAITARVSAGEALSDKDQRTLAGVYQRLEQYLTTKEPARQLNSQQLRYEIYRRFQSHDDGSNAFWRALSAKAPTGEAQRLAR